METIEEYKEKFDSIIDCLKVTKNITLYLVEPPVPGTPFKLIGSFGYHTEKVNGYLEQHYILTNRSKLISTSTLKEVQLLIKVGQALEKYEEYDYLVQDIRLPRSHGFKGIKMWFRQAMDMNPKFV